MTDITRVISDGSIALREVEEAEELEQIAYEFSDLPDEAVTITHRDANRILQRTAEIERQIKLIAEQEADEIERIRARASELREAHTKRLEWLGERYTPMLADFAARELDGKKERSIKLLSGKIGFRRNPSSLSITDTAAALEWAKDNLPDAVQIKESVGVSPLKSYVEGTGESLDFVAYVAPFDKFYMDAGSTGD